MLGLITFQYHKNNNHNTTNEFNVIFGELYFYFILFFYFVNFIVLFLDYLFGSSEDLMM